jgi:tetratricopeptide (TPR) repeat protein
MLNHSINNILKAVKINPGEVLVNYWAGKIFFASSDWNKTIEFYTKFLRINDKYDSEELIDKAGKMLKYGRMKEALLTFQKAKFLSLDFSSVEMDISKSKIILNNSNNI